MLFWCCCLLLEQYNRLWPRFGYSNNSLAIFLLRCRCLCDLQKSHRWYFQFLLSNLKCIFIGRNRLNSKEESVPAWFHINPQSLHSTKRVQDLYPKVSIQKNYKYLSILHYYLSKLIFMSLYHPTHYLAANIWFLLIQSRKSIFYLFSLHICSLRGFIKVGLRHIFSIIWKNKRILIFKISLFLF